jgi:hypothetical protein
MSTWSKEFLDLLVFLIKNWLDDPTIGVEHKGRPQYVNGLGEDIEKNILVVMDVKFPSKVEDCVQNWDMYP